MLKINKNGSDIKGGRVNISIYMWNFLTDLRQLPIESVLANAKYTTFFQGHQCGTNSTEQKGHTTQRWSSVAVQNINFLQTGDKNSIYI